jgi:hypothetical protein
VTEGSPGRAPCGRPGQRFILPARKENKRDCAIELYTYICRANVSYRDAFQRLEALQSGEA